jgi:chemosensory pili system protein ChpA (sensor histidine kinase/response regulator)
VTETAFSEPTAPEAPSTAEAGPRQAGLEDVDIDDIFSDLDDSLEDSDPNAEMFAQGGAADEDEPAELQVFDEDIFAGDFAGDLEAAAGVAADDIDAMFEDFGKGVDSSDEICGVHVDEFDSAAPAPQAAAQDTARASESVPVATDAPTDGSWCIPEGVAFNYASKSGTELFADFLDAFIEEGSSELEKLEDAIGAWESDVTSEPAFAAVARTLHTIKGIAKGVGLQYYGTLIHNYETLLEALPRPEPGAEAEYFRIVNAWLDAAVRGMDYVSSNRADIVSEFPQQGVAAVREPAVAEAAVESVASEEPVAETDAGQVTPLHRESRDSRRRQLDKQLADEGAKVLAAQQSVRITSEKLDHLLNLSNQAQQLGVRTAQSTNKSKRTSAEMQARLSSVRAHIANIADRTLVSAGARGEQSPEALDALEMDQYSELQEAANILREGVEDLIDLVELASRQNSQVEALLKQQATVIASIGSSIRGARVVPVSRLMPGLRRIVRTVSTDLDKTASFKVLNEVGTLDRDDYARCQIILEHMVRNALDHGIESREEREAAGKPATGQIAIDVRKCGADQIITLSDDGRGIDPEAMRESAMKKGLDVDVDALSDDEAIRLIFHKGFSTASTVSQISGRGVGMDIVLTELQEMGGDIQIDSTVGRGTSFRIRIPSNVAVNGALLVTAGENSYAIPLGGLISVEHVPVGDFFAAVEHGTPLSLSGMSCEPAYLGTLCQGESLPERKAWGASVPVIIAGSPERYMAIAIDDVEEALELVIRSLGVQFATVPGLAGAATTADGEAVVALDLNLLIADVASSRQMQLSVSKEKADALLALVVDDSRTQRMVTTSQLETVGVETVTAENGGVAIDLLNTAERLPDVILLDVEMPVKDGIQTLREIRKSVRYGHVPVIMVTSRTGLKHRSLAQEAGCNGYMGKPFNFRMLVGQINELTGHRLQLS